MEKTISEFDSIIKKCEDIFAKKMKDYGSAWRVLRISSLTDQIFIKAQRIRSIEEKGSQKVEEGLKQRALHDRLQNDRIDTIAGLSDSAAAKKAKGSKPKPILEK